jgi:hypothetical protein
MVSETVDVIQLSLDGRGDGEGIEPLAECDELDY